MPTPEVSVVMSVHEEKESLLRRAVESVLTQKGVEFEFIIVDDGCPPPTRDLLADYAHRNPHIRLLRQPQIGLTISLIRGCSRARADLIARQDSDDASLPGRLKAQVDMARSDPRLAVVSSWVRFVGPEGEILEEMQRPADPAEATQGLLYHRMGPPAHGSVLFRHDTYDAVGGYRPQFYYAQDADLWLRMATRGMVGYVQNVLYDFLVSPDSISSAQRDFQSRLGALVQKCHVARLANEDEAPHLNEAGAISEVIRSTALKSVHRRGHRRRIAAGNYRIAAALAKRHDPAARTYFRKAIRLNPWHWKAWTRWMLGC